MQTQTRRPEGSLGQQKGVQAFRSIGDLPATRIAQEFVKKHYVISRFEVQI